MRWEKGGSRVWMHGFCPVRCGACHGLPAAEWHWSGFPRFHPSQQGGLDDVGRVLGGAWLEVHVSSCSTHRVLALSPQMMQTNIPGVFAAGDAVTFPLAWRNNRKVNIPHWQMAHAQGMASPEAS